MIFYSSMSRTWNVFVNSSFMKVYCKMHELHDDDADVDEDDDSGDDTVSEVCDDDCETCAVTSFS